MRNPYLHAPPWVKRSVKVVGGMLAAWLVLAGIAAWRVPILVQDTVSGPVAELLGRPARVGKVSFNPFTLALRARALQIFEADGTTPLATVDGIDVDASIFSLFRLAPMLDKVQVTGPHLALVRESADRFNVSDIVDRLAARPAGDGKTPRFSLNNVTLTDGEITLDDRVAGRQHKIEALTVGVPFLSTLPYAVDIDVRPTLSARVNGSPFSLDGTARPFDTTRSSSLDIRFQGLALDALADAWPAPVPLVLKRATLDADLQLVFEAPPDVAPTLRLAGDVALQDVDVRAKPDAALLQLKTLALKQLVLEPLAKHVAIARIELAAPQFDVSRAADGRINLMEIAAGFAAPSAASTSPAPKSAAPTSAASVPAPAAWQVHVDTFALAGGQLRWRDEGANFAYALSDIALDVEGFNYPEQAGKTARLRLSAVADKGGKLGVRGPLRLQPFGADLVAQVDALALPALAPLWTPWLALDVASGSLDLKATVRAATTDGKWAVSWSDGALALKQFAAAARADDGSQLKLESLALTGVSGDLATRRVRLGQLTLTGMALAARRDASRRIGWAAMTPSGIGQAAGPAAPVVSPARAAQAGHPRSKSTAKAASRQPAGEASTSKASTAAPATSPSAPWTLQLANIAVDKSSLRWRDDAMSPRVGARLDNLRLQAANLSWPMTAAVDFSVQADVQREGRLDIKGAFTPQPMAVKADVVASRINLTSFAPYFAQSLNARIASLSAGARGRLELSAADGRQAQRVAWKGAAEVSNLELVDKSNGAQFLRWKRLGFEQLDVLRQGDRLKADLGAIALEDFFARLILRDTGRLNLNELIVKPGDTAEATGGAITQARGTREGAGKSAASEAGQPAADANLDIRMGGLTLSRGNINFTDNFVKPNYTANLTDIEGTLSALDTRQSAPAEVEIRGRVDGNAPVEIAGKLQPFGDRLYTDIRVSAKGVDLPGLTPYAAKYAGYPIERGKLSMEVHYLIQDGRLTATNKLVLDQLTIGDRLEGPSVFNLPVRLAVSLLKNSRGEINIDLPVAGSLDDPQFSVAGVVFRALGNLILRAVTAPFSLLASAFSGSGSTEALSYVEFEPGSAVLDAPARKKIDTLAAALKERPALKLDLSGRVDPAVDTEGLRKQGVEQLMIEQKRRERSRAGTAGDTVEIAAGERGKYLEAAYKAAKIEKPRNVIGFAKSLPDDQMQGLLEASIEVGPPQLRELALRRANAVMNVLRDAKLDGRAFLIAPHLDATGIKDDGKRTRVDFSLK